MEFRVVKVKLNDNSYEYLLTNLPTYMFDSNELKNLYYLRWGIETSFRDLKYSIGLSSFHARKPECVLQEIYAELIVYNFCELITSFIAINDRDTKYTYKINFAAAVVICMEFLRQAPGSSPMNVAALIGKFLTPIRTGLQSKRRGMRQKPFTFLYR